MQDLPNLQACLDKLPELHEQLETRLQRVHSDYDVSKKYVKLKFNDFVSTTIEAMSISTELEGYIALCSDAFVRGNRPVRLLGLGVKLELKANNKPDPQHSTHPSKRQLRLRLE